MTSRNAPTRLQITGIPALTLAGWTPLCPDGFTARLQVRKADHSIQAWAEQRDAHPLLSRRRDAGQTVWPVVQLVKSHWTGGTKESG